MDLTVGAMSGHEPPGGLPVAVAVHLAAVVDPGKGMDRELLYDVEVGGTDLTSARRALNRISHKLPVKVKLLQRKKAL